MFLKFSVRMKKADIVRGSLNLPSSVNGIMNLTPEASMTSRRGSRNSPNASKRSSVSDERKITGIDEAFSQARARSDAVAELQILLRHPDQLAGVPKLIEEYKAKLRDCEQRLSTAQHTQVDDVSTGLKLLATSSNLLVDIGNNNQAINASCIDCKSLFGNGWPDIKRAAVALTNMNVTEKVLSHFREIPKRVVELQERLDREDDQIKNVYADLRGLVQLRDAAAFSRNFMTEMSDDRRRNDFLAKRTDTFRVLQECANFVEGRIWENIEDAAMLAADEPSALLRTVEVIEMEDMAKRKVFSGLEEEAKVPLNKKPRLMRDQMFNRLRQVISKQFDVLMKNEAEAHKMDAWWATIEAPRQIEIKKYISEAMKANAELAEEKSMMEWALTKDQYVWLRSQIIIAAQFSSNKPKEKEARKPGTYVIEVFDELAQLMADREKLCVLLSPMFPPYYKIAEFYRNEYRAGALGVITTHTEIPRNLNKGQILKIINFLLWFERDQNKPGFLATTVEGLMEVFVRSTRETISNLITNILRLDEETTEMKGPDGFVITTGPSDLFMTINTQLDICLHSNSLRGTAVEYLALMLGDVLTDYTNHQIEFLNQAEQRDGKVILGERRLEKSFSYLCAIVNNCSMCQDNLEDVRARLEEACMKQPKDSLKSDEDHEEELENTKNKINDYLEQTAEGFVTVKTQAVDLLGNLLLESIEEFVAKLFGPSWVVEKFEESATDSLLAALQDSLDQYRDYLSSDPPFLRIVKFMLKSLVTEYLHKFIELKPKLTDAAIGQIAKDCEQFKTFFSNYADNVIFSPKYIDEEIGIMQLIEKVMGADSDFISVHFAAITNRFKRKALPIMKGLLAVREEMTKKEREDVLKSFQQQLPAEFKEEYKETDPLKHQGSKLKGAGATSGDTAKPGFWAKFKGKKAATKEKPSEKRKQEQAGGTSSAAPSAWSSCTSGGSRGRDDDEDAVDLNDFLGS